MNDLNRRMSLVGLVALAASPAWAADKAKVLPLKKLFPYLDLYDRLPPAERSRFALAYRMKLHGAPLSALRLTYQTGGQRTPVRLGADGRVLNLPPLSALADGEVEVSAPTGSKVSLDLGVVATNAPAPQMDARDLAAAVSQAAAAVHKAAGMLSFAAPKIERVEFKGATGGQLVDVAGKASPLPVVRGSPVFDPAKAPDARWIRFTRPPAEITLGPAK